ncbi:MAG: hypothetical protein QM820_18155 [Minicystis sp.]
MLLARVQDQLACTTAKAECWSCVSDMGLGLGYRSASVTGTAIISKKQFAHRGSTSSLFVRIPARLGNPEDRP